MRKDYFMGDQMKTVKELINILSKYDGDMKVYLDYYGLMVENDNSEDDDIIIDAY